jgi:RNA-directed DNA polymerase
VNARRANDAKDKVRELQTKLRLAAKESRTRRFHALYDKVWRLDVLQAAWQRVRANQGKAGVDRQTLVEVEAYGVERLLLELQATLREGKYRPQPVLRVMIPKGDGKMRPLGIPTVRDRIVQMAAKLVLEPIFEADFRNSSYGYRPGLSAHGALRAIRTEIRKKRFWVVDGDISGFFDNLNHHKLMLLVAERISDRRMLKLLCQWLKAGVMEEGKYHESELGTPQGGVISPLLANIYLNVLDRIWEEQRQSQGRLVRYADDFVIICRTRKEAEHAVKDVRTVLVKLDLTLHPEKTRLVNLWSGADGFDFLGFHHRWTNRKRADGREYYTLWQWPRKKAIAKIQEKVKQLLERRSLHRSLEETVALLNPCIRGWRQYYGLKKAQGHLAKLDWYITQRLTIWYNQKKQRRHRHGHCSEVYQLFVRLGLERLAANRMPQDEGHRKAV